MKSYTRTDRLNGLIREIIAELLVRHIKDPRLELATITGARISRDLSVANIYFSITGSPEKRENAAKGFESAKGFIRRELAKRLEIRVIPDLRFFYDTSFDYGARIESVFRDLKEEDPEP